MLPAAAQLCQGGTIHASARVCGYVFRNTSRFTDALEAYGNQDLHYDDWIRIGHALKRELPGADGLALWEWWSSLSAKNDPELTRRKWATFNPIEITAGTIFYLAEHGR